MKSTPTTKHTILWADDDADDLEIFRDILRERAPDHQLIEFKDGHKLLCYLQEVENNVHPCLIVLDINMPVLDGRETLVRIKKEEALKHIPVIVFTTSTSPLDKSFCDRYQTEMITKPPSYDRLKSTVQKFVEICQD